MPIGTLQGSRPAAPFWLLAAFLVLVFLTGGSQRADVQSLQVLRPIAILVAAYGLFTLQGAQWLRYRHVFLLLAAVIALVVAHLVPLPPGTWHTLPGRAVVRDIDALIALDDQWRPLSMVPAGTWNALYALSVPVAVLALTAQLSVTDHIRLLVLLIALLVLSGTLGLLQAIGVDLAVYDQADLAGLFANRNHQGVALAMLFPMLAVAAVWGDAILPPRAALIGACALAVIAIPLVIVTGSRAGLIALVVAILLIPLIGLRRRAPARTRRNRRMSYGKYVLAIIVPGFLVWMTVIASRETALTRFKQTDDDVRLPVWSSIVDVLPNYLPWGSGIGSYADVYQILEPDHLLRSTFSNHAHNEWLEIALTAGWPGIALIAWAVILFGYAVWRALGTSKVEGAMSRLGLSLILILSFASTVDYPVRTPIMSSVLAVAAVWASSFRSFGNNDGRD